MLRAAEPILPAEIPPTKAERRARSLDTLSAVTIVGLVVVTLLLLILRPPIPPRPTAPAMTQQSWTPISPPPPAVDTASKN